MKKLFLTSSGLSALPKFLGRPTQGLQLAYITTAANTYKDRWWLDKDREIFKKFGFQMSDVDIEGKAKDELEKILSGTDIIFIAGGNTFYLLEKIQQTEFDILIKTSVEKGAIYIGSSAGAVVAGPDIEPISLSDDPKAAPSLTSTKGLGFVNFVLIPHFDAKEYLEENFQIYRKYGENFKLMPLNNDQAVLVEGDEYKIVKSE